MELTSLLMESHFAKNWYVTNVASKFLEKLDPQRLPSTNMPWTTDAISCAKNTESKHGMTS